MCASPPRKLAASLGVANVTYEQGDAFDTESLLGVRPAPNVAIVSGLYELFPSNDLILASLRGLGGLIEPGGYLFLAVPNIEVYHRSPHGRFHFAHLHNFNRDSLMMMAKRAGFDFHADPDGNSTAIL